MLLAADGVARSLQIPAEMRLARACQAHLNGCLIENDGEQGTLCFKSKTDYFTAELRMRQPKCKERMGNKIIHKTGAWITGIRAGFP